MLMCAIISWGKDLLIRPCESFQWLKDLKRRLDRTDLSEADYIIFDSGFLSPLDFDNGLRKLSEEEVISAFGNKSHRRPKWDAEEVQKPRGEEWSAHEHVWDKLKREVIAKQIAVPDTLK